MAKRTSIADIPIEQLLANISDRNPVECRHCRRVESLSAIIAKEMGWESEDVEDLRLAALLHHMDKSRIPESALAPKVAGYLSEFDRYMRRNPERASKDRQIIEAAKIISLADTFDRLISDQRYRQALSPDSAIDILRHDAETPLDAKIVEAFCRAYAEGSERKAA